LESQEKLKSNKVIVILKKLMSEVTVLRCLVALFGIFLTAVGVAFNVGAHFGNDPVGIFYDGISHLTNLSLGMASNIVNVGLIIILLLFGRKYINVGTVLHVVAYGTCVSIGVFIYKVIFVTYNMPSRIVAVVIGCLVIYIGVAITISADVGLDAMTGVAMLLSEKLKWEFRSAKILYDVSMTAIGFVLGGKIGVITIITGLSAGPLIQIFVKLIARLRKTKR
jgi:uncharacterized membrane protein YczE